MVQLAKTAAFIPPFACFYINQDTNYVIRKNANLLNAIDHSSRCDESSDFIERT